MEKKIDGDGGSSSRAPKLKSSTGDVSPSATDELNMPPSSSSPMFDAPVDVEEAVTEVEGILVDSSDSHAKSGGGVRMKSIPTDERQQPYNYKEEVDKKSKCRSNVEFTPGSFNSQSQFAQGKEELLPSSSQTKLEVKEALPSMEEQDAAMAQSFAASPNHTSTSIPNAQFAQGKEELLSSGFSSQTKSEVSEAPPSMEACTAWEEDWPALSKTNLEIDQKKKDRERYGSKTTERKGGRADYGSKKTEKNLTDTTSANNNRCPQVDGIEVRPSASSETAPSKEDDNAQLEAVLSGPSKNKRLPAFTEVVSEQEDDGMEDRPSASSEKAPSKEDDNAQLEAVLCGPSKNKRLPAFIEIFPAQEDDDIEDRPSASCEKAPSKEDDNAKIEAVLYGPSKIKRRYGPSKIKRLPAFAEIVPEQEDDSIEDSPSASSEEAPSKEDDNAQLD